MTSDLLLSITGLCLLVPDTTTQRLHILAVNAGTSGMMQHFPRIYAPKACLSGGKDVTDHVTGEPLRWIDLSGTRIDLDVSYGHGPSSPGVLSQDIADISAVSPRRVDPAFLGPSPDLTKLAAHISMPLFPSSDITSGPWEFGAGTPALGYRCAYRFLGVPSLTLNLFDLKSGSLAGQYVAGPDATGQIDVAIYNVTNGELPDVGLMPPFPNNGDPAPHFHMYYELMDPATPPGAIPIWRGSSTRGSFVQCMLAQASL